jgi:hypothetical protein
MKSETPETAARKFLILSPIGAGTWEVVPAELAEKLERERKALREVIADAITELKSHCIGYSIIKRLESVISSENVKGEAQPPAKNL